MIYFDNASTTPVSSDILTTYEMLLAMYFANPSGTHLLAREVNRLQDKAREEILNLLNYPTGKVIFTSSASEANNLAIIGLFLTYLNRGNEIIISAYEHPSIVAAAHHLVKYHGAVVHEIGFTKEGQFDYEALTKKLSNKTVMVSLMAVNNEVGSLIDLQQVATLLKKYPKVIFHSDLTQAIGKLPLNLSGLHAFSFSAHKIHGLKGSGALIIDQKLTLTPLIHGGSQENGYRGGTSNAPTNIVLAKTVRLALQNQTKGLNQAMRLSNHLISLLKTHPALFVIHSRGDNPFIVNFSTVTFKASVILNALENCEIYIGTTSSCSAKFDAPSRSVLEVTHNNDYARNALRVSFSHDNTLVEVDEFFKVLMRIIEGANYGK